MRGQTRRERSTRPHRRANCSSHDSIGIHDHLLVSPKRIVLICLWLAGQHGGAKAACVAQTTSQSPLVSWPLVENPTSRARSPCFVLTSIANSYDTSTFYKEVSALKSL